eukprot:CAMPEP_0170158480 /NCGR_PEP_ID=MMETSP0033_2-20121228/68414_1 /TAXON_ID=195969 /ORGANISM="Dolichomastix tenuilepis, Strain CCMP3274" /LENGTH=238 /DNA_ID=CAMNT_0010395923 /DNA_START=57 /DNA_END=770 /DNA_ORIENTATION=+
MGDYSNALADASKSVTFEPNFAKGHSRKALAQFRMGHFVEASQSYDDALKLDPNNRQLQQDMNKCHDAARKAYEDMMMNQEQVMEQAMNEFLTWWAENKYCQFLERSYKALDRTVITPATTHVINPTYRVLAPPSAYVYTRALKPAGLYVHEKALLPLWTAYLWPALQRIGAFLERVYQILLAYYRQAYAKLYPGYAKHVHPFVVEVWNALLKVLTQLWERVLVPFYSNVFVPYIYQR